MTIDKCVQKKNLKKMSEDELRNYADCLEDRLESAYQRNLGRSTDPTVDEVLVELGQQAAQNREYVKQFDVFQERSERRLTELQSKCDEQEQTLKDLREWYDRIIRQNKSKFNKVVSGLRKQIMVAEMATNANVRTSQHMVSTLETHLL